MRATKAKVLRKAIYGEMSHRTREYANKGRFHKGRFITEAVGRIFYNSQCICTGLRRAYQAAKRVGHPPINPVAQILSGASR